MEHRSGLVLAPKWETALASARGHRFESVSAPRSASASGHWLASASVVMLAWERVCSSVTVTERGWAQRSALASAPEMGCELESA